MRNFMKLGAGLSLRQAARNLAAWLGLLLLGYAVFNILGLRTILQPIVPSIQPHVISAVFDVVMIDPGHGGSDDGASGHSLKEKNITLDLGQRLAAALQKEQISCVLTRDEDKFVSLPDRVNLANSIPNSIFISLHCNYSDNSTAKGIEVYRCISKSNADGVQVVSALGESFPIADLESELAQALDDTTTAELREENRGVKQANFFVVRNVEVPAVLVECGFLSNAEDAHRLGDPAYRQRLADALARGLISYRSEVITPGVKSAQNDLDERRLRDETSILFPPCASIPEPGPTGSFRRTHPFRSAAAKGQRLLLWPSNRNTG
jgi:N-acetylmuramoyl-L-alanine amidase